MKFEQHDKKTMNWQRRVLAIIGFLLPMLSTFTGFIAYDRNCPEFWYSISATFYATSNIFMIGGLSIFAFFLWTYKGYDIGDSFTCKFSALMCIGILLFPCKTISTGATTGVLNLPTDLSNTIHCTIAALLFASFVYMIGGRFVKSNLKYTEGKVNRNMVYRICSLIISTAMCIQVLTSVYGIRWMTIVNETFMLWAFSFAWAVKSGLIKCLEDKK